MSDKAVADSSYVVALFDAADALHGKARALAAKTDADVVFLDCVMNEVFSVLGKRASQKKRSKDIPAIYDKIIQKIPPRLLVWTYRDVPEKYSEILSLMKEHQGLLNFHDCLIALSARDLGIDRIISFDADFDALPWLKRMP